MKLQQTSSKPIAMALLIGALASGVNSAVSAATILFNDTFNTADSTDINENLARQTGTLSPISYNIQKGTMSISGSALQGVTPIGNSVNLSPDFNFTTFNNYSISVDIKPVSNTWSTFIIGGDAGQSHFSLAGTEIFFNASGDGSGTVSDGTRGYFVDSFGASSPNANGYWNLRIDVSTAGVDILTGNATVNVYVQNNLVSSFTRTSAYLNNYITLELSGDAEKNNTILWDNLLVTTIPEPGALALLGMGTLALVHRRRI